MDDATIKSKLIDFEGLSHGFGPRMHQFHEQLKAVVAKNPPNPMKRKAVQTTVSPKGA